MIVWGFVVILSAMTPNKVGHFSSLNQCYDELSKYIVKIETVDTANQYRGACQEFSKHASSSEADVNTQWLTSAQLAAMVK